MLERQWAAAATRDWPPREWPTRDWPPSDWQGRGSAEFVDLSDILSFFSRYVASIMVFALIGIAGASLYLATSDRIFTARTQILIEPKLPQFMQQQMVEVNLSLDTAQIESQLALLRSQKIAMMVIDRLDLTHNPVFADTGGSRLGQRLARLRALMTGVPYVHSRAEDGDDRLTPQQKAAEVFAGNLDVQRVGVSYAIDIYFQSLDPALAARIANATADAFVREQMENRAASARDGVAWLEKRIDEAGVQMNKATQIAQEFRATYDYRVDRPDEAAAGGPRADAPTLEQLEVAAETYRKMYESLLAAYTSAVNQQPFLIANSRVITAAVQPRVQSHPRTRLTLIFGAFAGLTLGIGVAFMRHSLDRTLRRPGQIAGELGLVCTGELPHSGLREPAGLFEEVLRHPHSPFSMGLREARAVVSLGDAGRKRLCIGVTAALPARVKSAVAGNLAALYAASGMQTLLIDLDPHGPLTGALEGASLPCAAKGEAAGVRPAAAAAIRTASPAGFDFIPNRQGRAANLSLPANMQDLLKTLDHYKVVIVDLPAYEHGADGLLVCPLLDGVMVVAESDDTPLDSLADLARTLRIANAPILGVLLARRYRLPGLRLSGLSLSGLSLSGLRRRRRSSRRPAQRPA